MRYFLLSALLLAPGAAFAADAPAPPVPSQPDMQRAYSKAANDMLLTLVQQLIATEARASVAQQTLDDLRKQMDALGKERDALKAQLPAK